MKCLIVVDMQNDFITGSLAVKGAQEIIGPIAEKIQKAKNDGDLIFYSKDWHPDNHKSFERTGLGGPWPVHCVQGSWGAELHPGLAHLLHHVGAWQILKGQDPTEEEYSAFNNHMLHEFLRTNKITDIEICGLARDYCVKATAEAATRAGYNAIVLEDLCRSVA